MSLRFLEYFQPLLGGEFPKSRRDGQTIARGFNPGNPRNHHDKVPQGRQNYSMLFRDTTLGNH